MARDERALGEPDLPHRRAFARDEAPLDARDHVLTRRLLDRVQLPRRPACHQRITSTRAAMCRTIPALPSTSTISPSRKVVSATLVPTTHGTPNSRATTAACDSDPPTSVTTAATLPYT